MKFSIIMPSYNQASYVQAALDSVVSQDYDDIEIIFIDGGSTDGTMEIVNKYRDKIDILISEPDDGQSHALDKGFKLASGDVYSWLNTDDLLLPGALREVAKIYRENPGVKWVLGNVVWINSSGNILKCWLGEGYTPGWTRLGLLTPGGPSAFFSRELYDRVGGINLDLNYAMDTELWWRFAMTGERYCRARGYIWALRLHERAKVSQHLFLSADDPRQVRVMKERISEKRHIENLISSHSLMLPRVVRKMVLMSGRVMSGQYLKGIYDTWRYRGMNIELLFPIRQSSEEV